MECTHRHGPMVRERLYDLIENNGQLYVSGWRWGYRCAACGKVSEWIMEQDRQIAGNVVTADERPRNAAAEVV